LLAIVARVGAGTKMSHWRGKEQNAAPEDRIFNAQTIADQFAQSISETILLRSSSIITKS